MNGPHFRGKPKLLTIYLGKQVSTGTKQRNKSVVGGQFRGLDSAHGEELTGKGTPSNLGSEQQVGNDVLRLVKLSALKEKLFQTCTKGTYKNVETIIIFCILMILLQNPS